MEQIASKCGHKHRSPEAAQKCFIKNFFVNFEQSILQCREQAASAHASQTKRGIHLVPDKDHR